MMKKLKIGQKSHGLEWKIGNESTTIVYCDI